MILEAFFAGKAVVYTATAVYAWLAGTAVVSGGLSIISTVAVIKFKHSTKKTSGLKELEVEQQVNDSELPNSLSRLVEQTDRLVDTASSNTLELRGQIGEMTTALGDEVQITKTVNLKLQSMNALLEHLCEQVSKDVLPIIFELQDRLSDIQLIHDELSHARERLLKTTDHLQDVVNHHADIQKNLQEDARKDKEIIQSLSSKLQESVNKLAGAHQKVDEKESQAKNEIYDSMMLEAGQKISSLLEQNKLLQQTVDSLTTELSSEQAADSVPRGRNITMFR